MSAGLHRRIESPPPLLPALADVLVVELGVWVAGPGAGGILADWGANVVKVEGPHGDPARRVFRSVGANVDESPPFMLDNRGKRSVVLDLRAPDDRRRFDELLGAADVFVTNLRTEALERLSLSPDIVLETHPRLVYASVTGLGTDGPDRGRPSYDLGAFWARTGLSHQLGSAEGPPLNARSGIGDHVTALALLAGIAGALFERERSGRGRHVEVSLQRVGAYVGGWDLSIQSVLGRVLPGERRAENTAPLMNVYRTSDDRWLFITALEVERHFGRVCRALDRPDLVADPRFDTASRLRKHRREFIAILDAAFGARTLLEWSERLEDAGVWWEPVLTPAEVMVDEQLEANDGFVDTPTPGGDVRLVNSPVTFANTARVRTASSPELGQHTAEVLEALAASSPPEPDNGDDREL